MMQSADLPGARSVPSGFTLATNTAKHSAAMANVTRLTKCFIQFPTHLYAANVIHFFDASAASTAAGRIGR